jgi:broad specificity phosphatase PhoE
MDMDRVGCVILVRHARTAWNTDGRLRGRLDPPLDDVGRKEAAALASAITRLHPGRVVSSPLRRATETARAITTPLKLQVVIDPRLADRDYGQWAGHREAAVVAQFGSLDRAPNVEPADRVLTRACGVLEEQREHIVDGSAVLVSHDAVNKLLLAALRPDLGNDRIPQRTACWNILVPTRAGWDVQAVDQKHL